MMSKFGYIVIQVAPTGKAVSVIMKNNVTYEFNNSHVYTIHGLLYGYGRQYHKKWKECKKIYIGIDEISMIDTELWYDLLCFIRDLKRPKLLLVGDCNQINPVGFGDITEYILKMCSDSHTNLTKCLRVYGDDTENSDDTKMGRVPNRLI